MEVRTPNFHVTSSFDESATRALARDLEAFHAGVLYAFGYGPSTRRADPTRVIAFDGRSLDRPFAERGESASYLPTPTGGLLMIRALGDFSERVTPDLRHRYAHRLLRDLSSYRPPLWYEEGNAQLASTVSPRASIVRIGDSIEESTAMLLDWRKKDLSTVLRDRDVSSLSKRDRMRFDATSWVVVHTILFDEQDKQLGRGSLDQIRYAYERDLLGDVADATAALGEGAAVTSRIYRHLEKGRHRVDRLKVEGIAPDQFVAKPVSPETVSDRLAILAMTLERPALALKYFDRATHAASAGCRSTAGRAWALAELGRVEASLDALASCMRPGGALGDDEVGANTLLRLGHAVVALGANAPETTRDEVSARLRALVDGEGRLSSIEGLRLLAALRRADGNFDQARADLDRAATLAPGSLGLDLDRAAIEQAADRGRRVRRLARGVLSRSHDLRLRKRAAALLEWAESVQRQ